ncbi:MAG TPA: TonB-dependent receptor [Steroidobacteraceae bacterium]|nr:TonB-dependent receptor [Steroidobacteraceae bacterium]
MSTQRKKADVEGGQNSRPCRSYMRRKPHTNKRRGIEIMRVSTILAAALLGTTCLAQTKHADAAIRQYQLNIPRQTLDMALKDLAQQTGLQIGRFSERSDGSAIVGPVEGAQTAAAALTILLMNTGLAYKEVGDSAFAVFNPKTANSNAKSDEKGPPTGNLRSRKEWRLASAAEDREVASAENSAGEPNSQADAMSDVTPLEIVVTATKRAERLMDVPLSVSVVDANAMTRQNIVRIQDYVALVPGLASNTSEGGQVQLAIRGITTGGLTNTTVGVTIDDVPIGGTAATSYGSRLVPELDPSVIQEVNVLKGPQGTLYGASSLGGLLRYVTKTPEYDQFSANAAIGMTGVAHGESGASARAAVNVPLSPDLALAASGFFRRDPGYVDDIASGIKNSNRVDNSGGRLALGWNATNTLSIRLSALLQRSNGEGTAQIDTNSNLQPLVDYNHTRIPNTGVFDTELQLYTGTLNLDLPFATLTSVTGYDITDFRWTRDRSIQPFIGIAESVTGRTDVTAIADSWYRTKKFSQEVRLASRTDVALEWLVGSFYTEEDVTAIENATAIDSTTLARVIQFQSDRYPSTYKEAAAFANLTYHFTPRFDVQLGGRYGENRQTFVETLDGPAFDPPYVVPLARSKESVFTYAVSPRLRISNDMTFYGRISAGYRPGGPNAGVGFGLPTTYGSDKTTNYEIGYKAQLFNRALSVEAALYRIDWDGIQLQQTDPVSGYVYFANASTARSQGFELAVVARPLQGLRLSGTLGYTDAELTEDAPSIATSPRSGARLPFSAPWSASLATDYDFPLASNVEGSLGFTVAYLDHRLSDFNPYGQFELPAYTTTDIRGSMTFGGWRLGLFASNLFDKMVPISQSRKSLSSPIFTVLVNRPRTLGMELSKQF